jgi:hypothetical protein
MLVSAATGWEPITVVGDRSLGDVASNVLTMLESRSHAALCFANTDPDNTLHRCHIYCNVTAEATHARMPPAPRWMREYSRLDELTPVRDGWWHTLADPNERQWEQPWEHLGTLADAVAHFARHALIIERGPGWFDPFDDDETLPLHLMRTVQTFDTQAKANDALQRGWYLLGIEYRGTTDERGDLRDRAARYVLGHTEEHAH